MMWTHWLKRLGWPGVAGLLLLLAASWVQWHWLPMQRDEVSRLQSQARRIRYELTQAPESGPKDLPPSPEEAWGQLWASLPAADQRIALQQGVLLSAKSHGLVVSAVQFRGQFEPWFNKSSNQGLWRQRITMPIEGSYASVRAWLAQALRQPAMSVDALEIQHTDVMSDQIKAQVGISLWWKQERAQ